MAERRGRDALHCPYCHGYEVRDRPLAVVAGDAVGAAHQALLLRQWSDDVVLLLHEIEPAAVDDDARALLAARDVPVVGGRVRALVVTGGRVSDGLRIRLLGDRVVQHTA